MPSQHDDQDAHRRRSLRLLGVDPDVANDRDDNPPPPDDLPLDGDTPLDLSQPLLSPPLPPDATFTIVDRGHHGRPTTNPRDAVPLVIINPPVPLHNQFERLGQDDTASTVSADLIETRFGGLDDDMAYPPSATDDALAAIAHATDDTIAEINAIPNSSPVFSEDLHRLETSITSRISSEIGKISSEMGVMGDTISSLFSSLHQSLANTTTELIADISQMNANMQLFKERVYNDHISVTAALTTLSGNTA